MHKGIINIKKEIKAYKPDIVIKIRKEKCIIIGWPCMQSEKNSSINVTKNEKLSMYKYLEIERSPRCGV